MRQHRWGFQSEDKPVLRQVYDHCRVAPGCTGLPLDATTHEVYIDARERHTYAQPIKLRSMITAVAIPANKGRKAKGSLARVNDTARTPPFIFMLVKHPPACLVILLATFGLHPPNLCSLRDWVDVIESRQSFTTTARKQQSMFLQQALTHIRDARCALE